MTQDSFNIANSDGATFRAALNTALQALASVSSGTSRPSTVYTPQLWIDTNTPSATMWTLNLYDGSDDIALGYFDTTNDAFIPGASGFGIEASIASAGTTDLSTVQSLNVLITGTTTISGLGTVKAGVWKKIKFDGALTLTHNATALDLVGGADIATAAGDTCLAVSKGGGNWEIPFFQHADGSAVGGARHKAGNTTYNLATATGTQDITGLGFNPKAVELKCVVNGTSTKSEGWSDGTTHGCDYSNHVISAGTWGISTVAAIVAQVSSGNTQTATITMIADGFRINWTKVGSPTGTLTIAYKAER